MSVAGAARNPPAQEPGSPRRRRSWIWWLAGSAVCFLFLAAIAAVLVVRSPWFSNQVRLRIVAEVETASGGRSEIGSFRFDWTTLQASVGEFVLHGTEPPGVAPLLRAGRIEVGLGITSFLHLNGVHVRSILVDQPAFHLMASADGKTNLPVPKVKQTDRDFLDTLLTLKASQIAIRRGVFELNDRRVPLDLVAKDVGVHLLYNTNRNNPAYFGDVSSSELKVEVPPLGPLAFAYQSTFVIEHGALAVSRARLSTRDSKIEISGFAYHLLNPSSDFGVNATLSLAEFAGPLRIPVERKGVVQFAGRVSLELKERFNYLVEGRVKGQGIGIRQGPVMVDNADLISDVTVSPAGAKMARLRVGALGGEFAGHAEIPGFSRLTLDGTVKAFRIGRLLAASGQRPLPFASTVSGPVHLEALLGADEGVAQPVVNANIALTAAIPERLDEIPLDGNVSFTWTQSSGTIELRQSRLATAASSIDFSGILGQRMEVNAQTTRLSDVQALLDEPLPISLKDGSMGFQGAVSGPLDNPRLEGKAVLTNFVYQKQTVDTAMAEFSATRDRFDAKKFTAVQGPLSVDGSGGIELHDWKADGRSPLSARIEAKGIRIESMLAESGQKWPLSGIADVSGSLSGSADRPEGVIQIDGRGITAWDEQIDRLQVSAKVAADRVELTGGTARFHQSEIPFHGVFVHLPGDWQSGSVSLNTKVKGLELTQVHNLASRWPEWKGAVDATLTGSGVIRNAAFQLTALNGDAAIHELSYFDRAVGTVTVTAATSGTDLKLMANADVRGSRVRLSGDWKLENGYPGGGEVTASSVTIQTLRELGLTGNRPPLPFQSAVEGGATFRMPLTDPSRLTAEVKIQRLFIAPGPTQRLGAGAKQQDLILENTGPVLLHVTQAGAVLEKASFRATHTDIEVGGKIAFEPKPAFDLTVKGGLNLAQLQMFRQDLLASGTASIDATVRGVLSDPQVNGSLTLSKASLYFGDLPVGLDNVNGSVTFDRNRATIQSLAAESGGGKMGLTGFIGFGGSALVYRLQGNAQGVRVRYPEGASTTVNAALSLNGTSERSLLAGTVTVVRAAFTPRSDLASLMAGLGKSSTASIPSDNDYIRGMQLDVRIESEPNLEFQTSLTRGLQADVDLRLRGTAARPSLLGDVGFSEGEISLFGNQYTLSRGDIRFFNPTRIEPVFDLEAETRARGIDVSISFSGTPSKLNVSYRSDPPLQPSDIIALLAIGRDPNVAAGLASSQTTQQSTASGLGNVVGEALASSLNNRLQRFFGVTKIKIDPQLTGLDNIPQARLTLEQQVSKDITMTFVTNIARTSEQIVRIQWDFSREWSGVAIRDENGFFGIDVQYRRRFK